MMKEITDIIIQKTIDRITFEIPVSSGRTVYMSIKKYNYCNDERCVVLVDSNRFLKLWRKEPYSIHTKLSMGTPKVWTSDYKYGYAERGFSYGINNPVPLADVSCSKVTINQPIYESKFLFFKTLIGTRKEQFDYVAFTNGITRTIWLLANEALFFPVECRVGNGSERLALVGGVTRSYFTVEELFEI